VLIVAFSLLYHYFKEQMRTKERLAAIEKGISPKEIYPEIQNNKYCPSRRESEIYGGIKVLIIGLFLALAIYVTTSELKVAIWGLFVAGIGVAKIVVGFLMKKSNEEN